jgi:hypothetical protein
MGTNCVPLLADLFLYSYESEFLQKLVKDKKIHEAKNNDFQYKVNVYNTILMFSAFQSLIQLKILLTTLPLTQQQIMQT